MKDVSVVIVSYNTKKLLMDCIDSIYCQTKGVSFEIIVCDNGSVDGTDEMVKENFPEVIYVANNANLGFGTANNRGAEKASGRYLFFLNPDTILLNDALTHFYNYFESNSEGLGCVGGYLLDKEKKLNLSHFRFPLPYLLMVLANGKNLLRNILGVKPKVYVDKYDITSEIETDFIIGADMFVPAKVFNEIGCFDENIFMYVEEAELQYRMKKAGLKRKIIPGPSIIHLEDQCKKSSNQKRIWNVQSLLYYYKKHYSFYPFYKSALKTFYRLNKKELKNYSKSENEEFFRVFK